MGLRVVEPLLKVSLIHPPLHAGRAGRAAGSRWPSYPLASLLEGYQCVRHDQHISYGNLGDSVPPFGMAFCHGKATSSLFLQTPSVGFVAIHRTQQRPLSCRSAGEQQTVLAVANEEGVVRLYDTESREKPLLKGRERH